MFYGCPLLLLLLFNYFIYKCMSGNCMCACVSVATLQKVPQVEILKKKGAKQM